MGLLNIIRRMALREKQSIREISRRTGLSRNTIAKYLNAGTIEPTFTVPERPSKLDPFADKLAVWLKTEAGKSRKQRRTLRFMPIWWRLALPVPMAGLPPSPAIGGRTANVSSRRRDEAYSFRCLSAQAKHSNSIGVRTTP